MDDLPEKVYSFMISGALVQKLIFEMVPAAFLDLALWRKMPERRGAQSLFKGAIEVKINEASNLSSQRMVTKLQFQTIGFRSGNCITSRTIVCIKLMYFRCF